MFGYPVSSDVVSLDLLNVTVTEKSLRCERLQVGDGNDVGFYFQRHLSDDEFEAIFQMSRAEFYRAPAWKRNDLKKRCRLF